MSSNGYVFTTRKQVLARLSASPEYAVECVGLLDSGRRWMASHRPRAARLVARLAAGATTAEDLTEAIALASCYARTLARLAREKEISERPELLASAVVFGVLRSASAAPLAEVVVQTKAETARIVDTTAPEPATPPKRRRGRPPGSRNRVREDEPAPKRRRRRS